MVRISAADLPANPVAGKWPGGTGVPPGPPARSGPFPAGYSPHMPLAGQPLAAGTGPVSAPAPATSSSRS